jgi:MoaA/NifB/PqqE/SkfB family radical SAM enzyme
LNSEFHAIVRHLHERGTTIVLTSNRYTAAALSDDGLRSFAYIELRLDFAAEEQQDAWRGLGICRLVLDQTERALRLGVAVTIIAVMMRTNYNKLPYIAG